MTRRSYTVIRAQQSNGTLLFPVTTIDDGSDAHDADGRASRISSATT